MTLDSPVFLNERRGPLTRAGDDGGSVIAIMLLGEDWSDESCDTRRASQPRPYLNIPAEVADLLKVHVKTMREMIKSTRLRATEIGREYRITGEQMRRYPEENKIKW